MQGINSMGKMMAEKMPVCKWSFAALETIPTKVGPTMQPISPVSASKANIVVPPVFSVAAALLSVPGHKIATPTPQRPQPIKLTKGIGISVIKK